MAKRGLFPGWKVVVGSAAGIGFGSIVFFAASFALLAGAWAQRFGWAQTELAKAAGIFLLVQAIMSPILGWFLDRWGTRKVAMISIVLFAISLAMLSQIGNSLNQMYLTLALMSLVSAGTNVPSYARAISLWFDRKRGRALGLAASSQAIGAFLMPVMIQMIIAQFGWSAALLAVAAVQLLVCLPLVALLVKNSPTPYGLLPDGAEPAGNVATTRLEVAGLELREILRPGAFWKLAVCFGIMGMSTYAIAANMTFILTKTAGAAPAQVAKVVAITGIAMLLGRITFGYLLDKIHGSIIGVVALLLTASCYVIYAMTDAPALIYVGAFIGGMAIGGETDLMPYLAGRFFGTLAVARIYGWFLTMFFGGGTIGPAVFAYVMAVSNSAITPLLMLAALQIVPAVIFLSLGPYPVEAKQKPVALVTQPVV
ncbi:MFS transporter [Bradyrhizobium neotropicale]|uniref:Major facilitator superfamily (MFS) profile domain-containing protein n=1 Tax=Bradyrhizobium neotropicale TaxID=1497615 RepID=A0A176ZF36_9BRAD|nr:MFS transporter [Bradyrhizobium neotropicale]OAF19159.1 hypothetical protein AXW67_37440 [Bradyrhizobium neotropicale]